MVGCGELGDGRLGLRLVKQSEPHGNRGKDAGDRYQFVVVVDGKGKSILLWRPKRIVHQTPLVLEFSRQVIAQILLAHSSRQIGKSSQGLCADTALVELCLHRKQRSALDPTMTHAEVFRQASSIVGRA